MFAGTGILDGDGYFGIGAGFVGCEFEKIIGILFDDCEVADVVETFDGVSGALFQVKNLVTSFESVILEP